MTSNQKFFVQNNNIPDFISRDHELYEAFVAAYYEWLEAQNDSEFNPGWLANNNQSVVDVDETVDKFIDYFANDIVPISLEGIQTDPRFFLKKIRELYLAKGTIKSFKLFFKLYYNDDIEVFETRDTILRASDGKFFAFPTAFFYITDFENALNDIDFTLAQLSDSDGNILGTVLEGGSVGKTKQNETIIRAQFTNKIALKQGVPYYIKNVDDNYQIQIKALVSLTELTMIEGGSLYDEKDPFFIESASLGSRFTGSIKSVRKGVVEGLKVRNRGIYYTVDDYFRIYNQEQTGQPIVVTEVGNLGDIKALNNYPLRTGVLNNGYLSGILEDVYVPLVGTTQWMQLPDLRYVSTKDYDTTVGDPYLRASDTGLGLQAVPVSRSIGKANFISLDQETFFKDSDDVVLNPPLTVVVENNNLQKGDKVAFQYFGNDANYHPRRDDSERLILKYRYSRIFETQSNTPYTYLDSEVRRVIHTPIPYGFDSELFMWKFENVSLNSKDQKAKIWDDLLNLLNTKGNINYKTKTNSYENLRIDGGYMEAFFVVSIGHAYDSDGLPIQRVSFRDIPSSIDGSIEKIIINTHAFDSLKDSEVFDGFISFMNANHGGAVNITTDVMKPITIINGGQFNSVMDSEVDGGQMGVYYRDLLDSWDTFDVSRGLASVMRVSFPDWINDSEIDGYNGFTVDSDDITDSFDGGDFFGFAGSKTEEIEIEYEGHYLQGLEKYHLLKIDSDGIGLDSDILAFNYYDINHEPRILDNNEDSDVGIWLDTGHYGEVIGVSATNKVVKVISVENSQLPTQEELDEYSKEKYNIVKLSKVRDGKSDKDHTLPLNNVVHQVDRIKLNYKTDVVSSLFQKFYSQDGFISSDYGGTIPDNYYYSDWSYRIKTKLPLQTWKEKFKTLLHPAGMVMTTDYSLNSTANVNISDVDIVNSNNYKTCLTFDKQQEYIDLSVFEKSITTDGIYYKSNSFEAENFVTGVASALNASSQTTIANLAVKQQNGNAWWDYEPIGLVRKSIDSETGEYYSHFKDLYVNWDSEQLRNRISTQDSDGTGAVNNDYYYYQFFDGSKQDLYKNQSRVNFKFTKNIMVSKVQFEDAGVNVYPAYDSDLPGDLYSNFNDSCTHSNFKAIDYQRLKSDSDNRYFQLFKTPRTFEISMFKERDLATAMKENNSLVFVDSDETFYDYDAYERKWNRINSKRTRNNEGYSINGFLQYETFYALEQRNKKRSKYEFTEKDHTKYTQVNAPHNIDLTDKDTLVYYRNYYDQINKIPIDRDYENETYRDPQVSMRGRRK